MDMGKSYQATITLGESTTTEDQTGSNRKSKYIIEYDYFYRS